VATRRSDRSPAGPSPAAPGPAGPRLIRGLLVMMAALIAAGGPACRRGSKGTIRVAAAADLAKAFDELGRAFTKKTGIKPAFSFGSSGLLAQQIGEGGAPFDVYAAANVSYVDGVIAKGACDGATKRVYARGRIVVWSRDLEVASLDDLADARFHKVAIAHPDHAPYGKAAKEALVAAGVWPRIERKVVFAENVRQTLQWAQSGEVDAALVALSLAVVTDGGKTLAIDEKLHGPLIQALAVCGTGPSAERGRRFVDFLASPEGTEIMKRYGFSLPE